MMAMFLLYLILPLIPFVLYKKGIVSRLGLWNGVVLICLIFYSLFVGRIWAWMTDYQDTRTIKCAFGDPVFGMTLTALFVMLPIAILAILLIQILKLRRKI